MGLKVLEWSVAILGIFLMLAIRSNGQNITIIEGGNATSNQVISGKPIVINTQLEYYDQPTLREYQECHENLEKCKTMCQGVVKPIECVKQCPVCPFLIKEKIIVQGVNDTDYIRPQTSTLNTTNIIRLTNQIHNVIKNKHGNITLRNENVVEVHQNISRVGGRFGLGYNNTDPCCIILSSSKNCEIRKFSAASSRCHRKRHRVCGEKCKSRVMLAKRVTLCQQPESADDYMDGVEENCHQTVKYVPYHQNRRRLTRRPGKCSYRPTWPFVSCQKGLHNNGYSCDRCQTLPYSFILRNGIPPQCRRCFMSDGGPPAYDNNPYGIYNMYAPFYPGMAPIPPSIMDNDFVYDYDFKMDGWQEEETKCKLPNGTISDNCIDVEGSGNNEHENENELPIKDPWSTLPEVQDDYENEDYENEDDFGPVVRRRRQTFPRSKYSRRYKQ